MSNEMPKDIVAELRIHSAVIDQLAGNIFERSADEIERLRRDYSCICSEMLRMMDERDEARRNYCWAMSNGEEHKALNIARSREWDCFKEDTNEQ